MKANYIHSRNGSFHPDYLWLKYPEFAAPVPVLAASRPVKQYPLCEERNTGLRAYEAREGTTPFGGDTGNTMPDSCGERGNTFEIGKRVVLFDGKRRRSYIGMACTACGRVFGARSEDVGRAKYCSRACHSSTLRRAPTGATEAERDRAHALVEAAIKRGELLRKPCQVCGSEPVDAHHPNYSKPLDVEWLCRSHHVAVHLATPAKGRWDR